jgi:fructokinase
MHHFEILPEQAYDHINLAICQETVATIQPRLSYFGSLALRGLESRLCAEQFLADSAKMHAIIFLDINLRAPWYNNETLDFCLSHAEYVKVNDEELAELAVIFALKAETLEEKGYALMTHFKLKSLYVTCGAHGAWMIDEEMQKHVAVPSQTQLVFADSVGAGDAFSAICIIGLLCGWPHSLSLQRANQFAASLCSVAGAAPSSLEHYLPFLKEWT